jgi:6-pyruvoyltetrahydropterin/6-carboxytetrahydropterin synthase
MFVSKEFSFDSAHFLTNYYGKCERVHGHTFKLRITVEGKVQSNGLVIDFVVLKRIVKKQVLDRLDHNLLNDTVENPSAERLSVWIWDQLKDLKKLLSQELDDPNLGEDLKAYFDKSGGSKSLEALPFDQTLRLHEIRLWETPGSFVTYRGE